MEPTTDDVYFGDWESPAKGSRERGSAGAQGAVVVGWLSAKGVPKARFSADASAIRLLYALILVLSITTGCGRGRHPGKLYWLWCSFILRNLSISLP